MLKYTDVELTREINLEIDKVRAEKADVIEPVWVTLQVCKAHRAALSDEETVDVAFFLYTSYTTVRKYATRCINALDPGDGEDGTATKAWLPGFEVRLLQANYVIERHGVMVGVPVELLTDAEIEAKASHYRSNSDRLKAHAAELLRYLDWRTERRRTDDDGPQATQPQAGA